MDEWQPSTFVPDPSPQTAGAMPSGVSATASAVAPAWQPSTFVPDKPQDKGFMERVGEDLNKRGDTWNETSSDYQSGAHGLPFSIAKGTGKVVAGSVNDVIGEGLKSIGSSLADVLPGSVKDPVKESGSAAGSYIANSTIGKLGIEAAKQGMQAYKDFKTAHPDAADMLESTLNVAALMPAGKAAESVAAVAPGTAETVIRGAVEAPGAAKEFGKNLVEDVRAPLPGDVSKPKFDPASVHAALNDSYKAALKESKGYYNAVREMGEGLDVPVDNLRKHLDSVIGEIADDPLHEGKSALSDLKRIRTKIGDPAPSSIIDSRGNPIARKLPDTATATDLLDIKQFLNENFNPKRFAERADNPYTQLSKTVKGALKDVGDMHPPFADALNTADKYWVNGVDLPYRSNSVLHRVWNPEDYNAQQSIERGMADSLPPATQERQYKLLKSMKNPVEYKAVADALPPAARDEFAGAVKNYIQDDLGLSKSARAKNLAKGVFNFAAPNPVTGWHPRAGVNQILKGIDPDVPKETADILKAIDGKPYARGGAVADKNPTAAQKVAGNYKKHHIKFHGLDISIENPKGSERTGENRDGKQWKSVMPDHYGYIKRTQGADGDHLDVYVGENERSNRVYVIDQKDAETGKFDEHKVMLGYSDRDAAEKAYRAAFSDKKNRIMKVTRFSISEFKDWLKHGNTKQPVKK